MRSFYSALLLTALLPLAGCQDNTPTAEEPAPVRGLKTQLIEQQVEAALRRYPSVLQPSDNTQLSFEISGRLNKLNLNVGQVVQAGDVLASLDQRALNNELDAANAAVAEASATAANALKTLNRQEELLVKKLVSRAAVDDARTSALGSQARLEQVSNQLESAKTALSKATLKAPYSGVINSVPAESFTNVSPGAAIATLSNPESFEINFSVSYDVVGQLSVGKAVSITLADAPEVKLAARISELSRAAKSVETFPVVAQLSDINPALKAGMAVEVEIELPISTGKGYTLPISALMVGRDLQATDINTEDATGTVFVFDEATQTVKKRQITMSEIRENSVVVSQGLQQGEHVAIAGITFLREGQKVKLLIGEE